MSIDSSSDFSDIFDLNYYNQNLDIWSKNCRVGDEDKEISLIESHINNPSSWPMDIHTAASIGCYDWIKINIGEDCNRKNLGGWTALMYACHAGYLNVAKFLINCDGCRINELNRQGHTPLILAASCGNEDLVEILLEKGAELESADVRGQTALYHASVAGHKTVVRLLVDKGANYNVTDFQTEMTPFMEAVAAANEIIVQFFLFKGVDLTQKNSTGQTALDIAILRGHTKITKMMQDYQLTLKKSEAQRIQRIENSNIVTKETNASHITEGPQAMNNLLTKMTKIQMNPKPTIQVQALRSQQPRRESPVTTLMHNQILPVVTTASSNNTTALAHNLPQITPTRQNDLKHLLSDIGLSKYLPMFEEQDVDMMVFLTLDDKDLKELGINLLGPRKKILLAISRWHENQQSSHLHSNQDENRLRQLSLQLLQAEQTIKKLGQELQREEQLRSLVENCVIGERSTNQHLVEQLANIQLRVQEIIVIMRSNEKVTDLDAQLDSINRDLNELIILNKLT